MFEDNLAGNQVKGLKFKYILRIMTIPKGGKKHLLGMNGKNISRRTLYSYEQWKYFTSPSVVSKFLKSHANSIHVSFFEAIPKVSLYGFNGCWWLVTKTLATE